MPCVSESRTRLEGLKSTGIDKAPGFYPRTNLLKPGPRSSHWVQIPCAVVTQPMSRNLKVLLNFLNVTSQLRTDWTGRRATMQHPRRQRGFFFANPWEFEAVMLSQFQPCCWLILDFHLSFPCKLTTVKAWGRGLGGIFYYILIKDLELIKVSSSNNMLFSERCALILTTSLWHYTQDYT